MSVVEYISRQYPWRRWSEIYPYLGDLSGVQVVDLGCGIGDQARDLSRLGAYVFGVDDNEEAINFVKSRRIPHAQFIWDLFHHEPLHSRWFELIEKYYARSIEEGIYRFRSHTHVSEVLSEQGLHIEVDRRVDDDELCFAGAASTEVIEAWQARLDSMMPRFLDRFGDEAMEFFNDRCGEFVGYYA